MAFLILDRLTCAPTTLTGCLIRLRSNASLRGNRAVRLSRLPLLPRSCASWAGAVSPLQAWTAQARAPAYSSVGSSAALQSFSVELLQNTAAVSKLKSREHSVQELGCELQACCRSRLTQAAGATRGRRQAHCRRHLAEDGGGRRGLVAMRCRNAARVCVRCCSGFCTVSLGMAPLATARLMAAAADEQQSSASCALRTAACSSPPSPP